MLITGHWMIRGYKGPSSIGWSSLLQVPWTALCADRGQSCNNWLYSHFAQNVPWVRSAIIGQLHGHTRGGAPWHEPNPLIASPMTWNIGHRCLLRLEWQWPVIHMRKNGKWITCSAVSQWTHIQLPQVAQCKLQIRRCKLETFYATWETCTSNYSYSCSTSSTLWHHLPSVLGSVLLPLLLSCPGWGSATLAEQRLACAEANRRVTNHHGETMGLGEWAVYDIILYMPGMLWILQIAQQLYNYSI